MKKTIVTKKYVADIEKAIEAKKAEVKAEANAILDSVLSDVREAEAKANVLSDYQIFADMSFRYTTRTESTEQRTATVSRYSKAQQRATQKAQKAQKAQREAQREAQRKEQQLAKNRAKKAQNDSIKRETLKDVFAKIQLMKDSDVRFMKDSSTAVRFFNKVMFRVAVTNSKLYRIYSIESVTDNIKTKFDLHIKAKSRYTAKNNLTESEAVAIINEMLAVIC